MRLKKGQANAMLTIGIAAIITVIILGVVINFLTVESLDSSTPANDEVLPIVSGEGRTDNPTVLTVTFFGNGTFNTSIDTIDVDTDVNFTRAGVITVAGVNFTDNPNYIIDYTYEPSGYIESSNARRLVNNIPVLLAVLILVAIGAFAMFKG